MDPEAWLKAVRRAEECIKDALHERGVQARGGLIGDPLEFRRTLVEEAYRLGLIQEAQLVEEYLAAQQG